MFNFKAGSLDPFLDFLMWYEELGLGNDLNYNQKMQFSVLAFDNHEACFRLVYKSKKLKLKELNLNINKKLNKKDETIALEFKNEGNMKFKGNNWNEALKMYNQCYHATPTENVKDVAIVLANRSAALYNMEMYDLAINDIELAMPNYPRELMFKIKQRKAKCLLAKKELRSAIQHFQETIACLDESGLSNDKRVKLEKEIQIQIQMLLKELTKPVIKMKKSNNELKKNENILHEFVGFDYNENEGHFAIAKEDIKIGEEILVQEAHCFALSEEYCQTNCQHCFKCTIAPLPCPSCSNVVFCSENCRNEALASYHKYECKILPLLWILGPKPLKNYLPIRIITQKNLDYFLSIKDELKNGIKFEDTLKLPPSDYRKVYNLEQNEKRLHFDSIYLSTLVSTFLAFCLKLSGYFESDNDDHFYYIGGLILRNLNFLHFNTHAINELQGTTKVTIGVGLYPTLSLFNHSCNPSIYRYFKGTTVVVNSINFTKAGDMIAENYDKIYSKHSIEERFLHLHFFSRFKCNCLACKENWPLYTEMNEDVFQLKCRGKKSCSIKVNTKIDILDCIVKCKSCRQYTKISSRLQAIGDAFSIVKNGKKYFENGEYKKAIDQFVKALKKLDKIILPTHPSYVDLQQYIEKCLLNFGNKAE